jgi:ATP-dependent Clp protease adaptor protein ClpS
MTTDTKTLTEIRPKIAPKEEYKEPKNFNVIYVNDEVTTFEFVVETLTEIFGYNRDSAEALTMKVHDEESAVVANLPYEMAEQKGIEVTLLARQHGFPLQVKIEQDI